MVIPDVQALRGLPYAKSYLALNLRSTATVVIQNKGQLLGRLNIATVGTLRLFTQDELALLRGLADQAALAINNAYLFEEIKKELLERKQAEEALRQHVARSRALNDISQALAQARLDTQSLLQTVVERVAILIGDGCVMSLISSDKDNQQWIDPVALHHRQPKAIALMKNLVSATRLRVGEGIIGRVAQNGQALLMPVIPQDELKAQLKPEHRLYAEQVGLHSAIYVPLRISGRLIGTLGITRDQPNHPYSQEDQLFLQEVADRAALAIANAELFETVQHQLSERRRAEEERKRFFNLSKDMFTVVSADGQFKQLNPAWQATLGFSLEQLFKEPFFKLIHPDDRPLTQAEFQKLTQESSTTSFEVRLQCATNTYRWTAWNMTAFKAEGVIYAVGRDITERKEVEVILRKARDELERRVKERTAELKQANKEIRRFAYIVSHDLRAPLVNLKGFAGELRFALAEIEPILTSLLPQLDTAQQQTMNMVLQEEIPEAMDFIDSSVTRMNNLISALLKLSRLGHREFIFEQIDMDELLETTLDTLAHQIEQRQVTVNVSKLPHLVADRVSMEQIMSNLLTNAVLYLEPTRRGIIDVRGSRHPSESIFHIQDNGRGIAANDLDKLFEPFRRIGKPDVPGEGMGLAYVQTLVRRHGGRIWCQSQLGGGTTFSFSISHHLTQGVEDD